MCAVITAHITPRYRVNSAYETIESASWLDIIAMAKRHSGRWRCHRIGTNIVIDVESRLKTVSMGNCRRIISVDREIIHDEWVD